MSKFTSSLKSTAAAICGTTLMTLHSLTTAAAADVLSPIWTGVYAGVHGGANWSDVDFSNLGSVSNTAFLGGGHIGMNMNFGSLIAGVEGDWDYDDSSYGYLIVPGGTTGHLNVDWTASLRGRLGMNVGPALLYATAGIAWSERSVVETTAAGVSGSNTQLMTGLVYGIGAETFVLPNLSLRLEALHYNYGSEDISISAAAAAIKEIEPSDTVVRAGVTFHLN